MEFAIEQSPHIRRKDTLAGMMADVLIALSPVVIFALIVYQLAALRNLLVSEVVWVFGEFVYVIAKSLIAGRKDGLKFKDKMLKALKSYKLTDFLVPTVSAVIFALITPTTFWGINTDGTVNYNAVSASAAKAFTDSYSYVVLVCGSLFGLVVGKLIFGGTGKNLFNPAAAALVFSKFVFGKRYAVAKYSTSAFGWKISTGATVLAGDYASSGTYSGTSLWGLIIGDTAGVMGETCKIAILLGLVYLLVRHVADWRVVVSYFATFLVFALCAGIIVHAKYSDVAIWKFVLSQLFSGGLIFGGVFMITDPVTMPLNRPDRVLYGMVIAICVAFFRYLGYSAYTHEGVAFSILIANAIVPLLDYFPKWVNNQYDKKHLIVLVAVPVVLLAVFAVSEHFFIANHTIIEGGGSTSGLFLPLL
jgi:Na+-translocating ferredoxin:NAD+ oxidoreductase subunit D